jgi:hypothetical protein
MTAILDLLDSRDDMKTVILVGRWAILAEGTPPPGETRRNPVLLADTAGRLPSGRVEDNFEVFRAGVETTLARIMAGGRQVVVLGPTPEIGWSVPDTLGRSLMFGRPTPPAPTEAAVTARMARVDALFTQLADAGVITYLPTVPSFCDETCDIVNADGKPLYWDGNHLSRTAAQERITPVVAEGLWSAKATTPTAGVALARP